MNTSIPPCHSRQELPEEHGVYFCRHPRVHAPDNRVTAEICRICCHREQPAPVAPRPFEPGKPRSALGPCRHLGDQIGERACLTCRGSVRLKVYGCGHPLHVETTLGECAACADYEPRAVDAAGSGTSQLERFS